MRLDHPNIIKFYGIADARPHPQNVPFHNPQEPLIPKIFMEYIPGSRLTEVMHCMRRSRCTWEEKDIARYIYQLLSALHHIHKIGMVHRDIKPDNLMMSTDGRLVVIDFGSCIKLKLLSSVMSASQSFTPAFAAPEVFQTYQPKTSANDSGSLSGSLSSVQNAIQLMDHRADIWSVGCVAVSMMHLHPTDPWFALNLGANGETKLMRSLPKDVDIGSASKFYPIPYTNYLQDVGRPDFEPGSSEPGRFKLSHVGHRFLQRCFTQHYTSRPQASELLEDPWFKAFHRPNPNDELKSALSKLARLATSMYAATSDSSKPDLMNASQTISKSYNLTRNYSDLHSQSHLQGNEVLNSPSSPSFHPPHSQSHGANSPMSEISASFSQQYLHLHSTTGAEGHDSNMTGNGSIFGKPADMGSSVIFEHERDGKNPGRDLLCHQPVNDNGSGSGNRRQLACQSNPNVLSSHPHNVHIHPTGSRSGSRSPSMNTTMNTTMMNMGGNPCQSNSSFGLGFLPHYLPNEMSQNLSIESVEMDRTLAVSTPTIQTMLITMLNSVVNEDGMVLQNSHPHNNNPQDDPNNSTSASFMNLPFQHSQKGTSFHLNPSPSNNSKFSNQQFHPQRSSPSIRGVNVLSRQSPPPPLVSTSTSTSVLDDSQIFGVGESLGPLNKSYNNPLGGVSKNGMTVACSGILNSYDIAYGLNAGHSISSNDIETNPIQSSQSPNIDAGIDPGYLEYLKYKNEFFRFLQLKGNPQQGSSPELRQSSESFHLSNGHLSGFQPAASTHLGKGIFSPSAPQSSRPGSSFSDVRSPSHPDTSFSDTLRNIPPTNVQQQQQQQHQQQMQNLSMNRTTAVPHRPSRHSSVSAMSHSAITGHANSSGSFSEIITGVSPTLSEHFVPAKRETRVDRLLQHASAFVTFTEFMPSEVTKEERLAEDRAEATLRANAIQVKPQPALQTSSPAQVPHLQSQPQLTSLLPSPGIELASLKFMGSLPLPQESYTEVGTVHTIFPTETQEFSSTEYNR